MLPCSRSAHVQQLCRPSLLLDKEFEGIEGNLKALEEAMPGADVRKMVAAQPLFLSEDIKVILGELRRCALAHQSSSATRGWVTCSRWPDCSCRVFASLQPGKDLREIVRLLGQDPKLSDLLVLRLDVRAQVREGMPRMKYP